MGDNPYYSRELIYVEIIIDYIVRYRCLIYFELPCTAKVCANFDS